MGKGRPTKADRAEVLRRAATERPVDIARDLGVAPSTIQRILMDAGWGPTGLWAPPMRPVPKSVMQICVALTARMKEAARPWPVSLVPSEEPWIISPT